MKVRLIPVIFFCGLFLSVLPSRAQLAFSQLVPATQADFDGTPEAVLTFKIVHGVVQGQEGTLPGATVWLHGSRTIAVANAEGEFELRVPANATVMDLTCGYGGLEDEIIRLAPAQALGSLYLLRPKRQAAGRQP